MVVVISGRTSKSEIRSISFKASVRMLGFRSIRTTRSERHSLMYLARFKRKLSEGSADWQDAHHDKSSSRRQHAEPIQIGRKMSHQSASLERDLKGLDKPPGQSRSPSSRSKHNSSSGLKCLGPPGESGETREAMGY